MLYSSTHPIQHSLQQKGCCIGLYNRQALRHGPVSIQHLYSTVQHCRVLYSYTALQQLYSIHPLHHPSVWIATKNLCNSSHPGSAQETIRVPRVKSRLCRQLYCLFGTSGRHRAEPWRREFGVCWRDGRRSSLRPISRPIQDPRTEGGGRARRTLSTFQPSC